MGGTTLASNFTTSAITVAGARGLCQVGAPRWAVVEATIAGMHQVPGPALQTHERVPSSWWSVAHDLSGGVQCGTCCEVLAARACTR